MKPDWRMILFFGVMALAAASSILLPGILDLSSRQVDEAILIVLLPVLFFFIWWAW